MDQDEDGNPLTVADIVPDGRPALDEEVAFSIDIADRMARLSDEQRDIVERMRHSSHAQIAREMGLSKMEFHRRHARPIQRALAPEHFRKNHVTVA